MSVHYLNFYVFLHLNRVQEVFRNVFVAVAVAYIVLTISVSVASGERGFSKLKQEAHHQVGLGETRAA